MSLNFVESLIDKLFSSPKGTETPLIGKFTGSQNLMGYNSRVYQSIPPEFHQIIIENDYFAPTYHEMNHISISPGAKKTGYYLESSNHSLVSRVPKLFSPSISTFFQGSFHLLSRHTEMLFDTGSYLDSYCESERKKQSDLQISDKIVVKEGLVLNMREFKPKCDQKEAKIDPVSISIDISVMGKKPIAQRQIVAPVCIHAPAMKSQKYLVDNSRILNQELASRKTKELQKRSKKRRRRQNRTKKKGSSTENCKSERNSVSPTHSDYVNHGVICDRMVTIRERTNSVEIVLPNLSSFVISVESAEDDSEWDDDQSSEWTVNDCAEFELSGLFMTNLTACKTSSTQLKDGFVSQLRVPCYEEDLELYKLDSSLRMVNQRWNEITKKLDSKPKESTKVSFAPECDLVTIVPVEMYVRKGEWEMYATERLRFKRRIDDLGNILSPCLSKEHREKIFLRLQQSDL